MFALKDYQDKALAALDGFFYKLRAVGLEAAWLDVIVKEVGETRLDAVTVQWAADVVHGYKIHKQLKPATITLFG